MSDIAELIAADRSVPNRCFFFGQTTLGGSDACRPEIDADGEILMRSLNLSHTVYRITEESYRELRQYPQRKIGIWDFVREDDQDADHIASATRAPQFAGRTIGDLTRRIAAKDVEIAKLREALAECEDYFENRSDADCDETGFIPNEEMKLLSTVQAALAKAGEA